MSFIGKVCRRCSPSSHTTWGASAPQAGVAPCSIPGYPITFAAESRTTLGGEVRPGRLFAGNLSLFLDAPTELFRHLVVRLRACLHGCFPALDRGLDTQE
jgi:hypothetical protein